MTTHYSVKKFQGSKEQFNRFVGEWKNLFGPFINVNEDRETIDGDTSLSFALFHSLLLALIRPYPGLVLQLTLQGEIQGKYIGGNMGRQNPLLDFTTEENRDRTLHQIGMFSSYMVSAINFYNMDHSIDAKDLRSWTLQEIIDVVKKFEDEK